jgi:outer membrane receptor protein involved in Fe transport
LKQTAEHRKGGDLVPRKIALVLFILVLTLAAGAAAFGQGYGSMAGSVKDSTGGVVPGAEISATNLATNAKSTVISNDIGYYQILQLSPGRYMVAVEMAGFKKVETTNITVHVGDRLSMDFTMQVGEIDETVIVPGESVPLLRSQDAQAGEVVTHKHLQNLPQLQRDPLQLLILAGNVQGGGKRAAPHEDTRLSGGRTGGIEYFVDGISAGTGIGHDVTNVTPNMEAVGEFRVMTGGISAEHGRYSGGAVELVTRSGANQLHGQVFEYMQNDAFNANSWNFNRLRGPNDKKAAFRHNNFGATLGGPVYIPKLYNGKDRTFFFFNYDGFRWNQAGALREASLMTELERRGDYSQTLFDNTPADLYVMEGPYAWETDGDGNQQLVRTVKIPNNTLPQNMISPVSLAILKYIPLPNRPARAGTSNQANYVAPQDSSQDHDIWGLRLDHRITENQSIFGRFTHRNRLSTSTRWRGPLNTAEESRDDGQFGLTVNYDWSFSPSLIFNARTGGHYNPNKTGRLLAPEFTNTDIPFDSDTRRLLTERGMPGISITGIGDLVDSWATPTENLAASTTYNAAASMVKILTKHTVKFGYEHRRYYDNFINGSNGQFVFLGTGLNRLVGDKSWSNMDQANGPASFLFGYNSLATVAGSSSRALNMNYHAVYVQDDFKVSPRLTLNLGLRWDMETPVTERFDKLYFWDKDAPSPFTIKPGYDFNQALRDAGFSEQEISKVQKPGWLNSGFPKGAIRIANTPEYPSRKGQSYYPWQFAPRFGAAYRLTDQTVLRASFGQVYFSVTGDQGAFSTGAQGIALGDAADAGWHASDDGMKTLTSHWSNPFNRQGAISYYQRDTQVANFQATGLTGASAFNSEAKMPHEWAWNLGLQRQLAGNFMVEAAYAGNMGRDLLGPDLVSHFPRDLFVPENATLYESTRRIATPFAEPVREYDATMPLALFSFPYPYYGPVRVLGSNIGRSDYHSLNLRADLRYTKSVGFLFNYTLSSLKDDVGGANMGTGGQALGQGGTGSKSYQSLGKVTEVYGLSPLDERHVVTAAYNIELPFGKGRRFLGAPNNFGQTLVDYIIGGWEFAGMSRYRSGRPIRFSHSTEANSIRVEALFHSWANPSDTNLVSPDFSGHRNYLYSSTDPSVGASTSRALLAEKIILARPFVYGTLPPIWGGFRHPGRISEDVSLMKRFRMGGDGERFLQVRMEAANLFNRAGFAEYETDPRSNYFGLIRNKDAFTERRIQMSARFVF